MTNLPFGFGPADRDPDDPSGGNQNPFAAFGMGDAAGQMPLFAELQKVLSWNGGPVNWDLARQLAVAAATPDSRVVGQVDRTAVLDAVRLADLWLDDVTDLPSGVRTAEVWSRTDWVARTLDGWGALCDPVAGRVVAAMGDALPAEAVAAAGPLGQVMSSFGGLMFGAQVGQALGALAGEIVSTAEIGFPLAAVGVVALLPQNVRALAADLERPEDEVRLYLALRETAHQRLYAHVPWLRQHVVDTVEAYARGISIDASGLQEAMGHLDPTNPEALQAALGSGMFEPDETPAQKAALGRLETLLALIEGWVDTLVDAVAAPRLAGAAPLREALRRRRASGGPAEQTFATLVGLQLRPRRLRDAATLWWALTDQVGASARDAVWEHPDLLPTAADLDDPLEFARRRRAGDLSGEDAAALIEAFEALTAEAAAAGDRGTTPPAPDGTGRDSTAGSDGTDAPDGAPGDPGHPGGPDGERGDPGPAPA